MDANITTRLTLILTLLVTAAPLPGTTLGKSALSPDQTRFLEAEQALKKNQGERYRQLKSQLSDYPLLPYLEFSELKLHKSSLKSDQVERFLTRYKATPLAPRMRRFWLKELAKRQQWWVYLTFHRPDLGSKYDCHRLRALLETGRSEQAFTEVPALWLSAKSQPDACNPVFDRWRQAGGQTTELVWQRVELAMTAGRTSLARYLKRYLPTADRMELDLWLQLHKSPGMVSDKKAFRRASPQREKMLLHGFKRLARRDHTAALDIWPRLTSDYRFSKEQLYQGEQALLRSLASNQHPGTLERLDRFTPEVTDERFLTSRIRTALEQQAWEYVLNWINALPEPLKSTERWRYWRARALAAQGETESANKLFDSLSAERSYYGFLAADQSGNKYRFDPVPLVPDEAEIDRLATVPGIRRAGELLTLDRMIDARREWHLAVKEMPQEQLQVVSKLAQRWGWHDRAIFTLARTGYWDDLELRFPLKHQEKVASAASGRKLDNAWVFAVIRQESAFIQDAHSSAGALGLMQLMPATARFIAKKINRRKPKKHELLNPDTNITLGTAYLNRVYRQLGENQVLATAAYNAGPHRVNTWLPETVVAADLWVETIPFKETRGYTQRVLSYAVIYDQRLGRKPTPLSQRMSAVHPKSEKIEVVSRESNKKAVSLQ